jgi:molybdopterin-guanine dinucleotide biosynthesis protein MobB
MTELRGAAEPPLSDLLAHLDPCDLVLVEGYKTAAHPKVEAHRAATGRGLLAPGNATIRAIASDTPLDHPLARFDLDDIPGIARFILAEVGL